MKHMSRGRLMAATVFLAAASGFQGTAQAIPITGTFSGTVTLVSGAVPGGIAAGNSVSGTFTYDTGGFTWTYPALEGIGYSTDDRGVLRVTINGLNWVSGNGDPLQIVVDDDNSGGEDILELVAVRGSEFPNMLEYARQRLWIKDTAPPLDLLTGEALPSALDVGRITFMEGWISNGEAFGPTSLDYTIHYTVNTQDFAFSGAAVPEPGTLALVAFGALGLLGLERRKRG